jgi:outer membrane protein assembly factor BamA
VRIVPDLRAYVPLPLSIVLAARFALGMLLISDDVSSLIDQDSARLGPNSYRLRGGGSASNRGFSAGTLGDSRLGGTRRFEGSLELRIPLGEQFGLVAFGDIGNVSDPGQDDEGHPNKASFGFNHLNAATGFGLRLYTVLGAIRFDAGWRIPGLQTLGVRNDGITFGAWPSAMHLTIGEAF